MAGWTPTAAAAAIPAERMSFAAEDEPGSDRLLMFSVLGIVVVVAVAFAYSMLTRKQPLPSVQPPVAVVATPQPQPQTPQSVDNSPMPAPQAPAYTPPTYEAPPAETYQPPVQRNTSGGNRKIKGILDATGDEA